MTRPPQITNEEEWQMLRTEVVRIARGVLDRSIGIVAGARLLAALCFRLRAEDDSDFLLFRGIDSESDHFPIGEMCSRWSADALARYDAERESAEAHWRAAAETACRSLIQKYGDAA